MNLKHLLIVFIFWTLCVENSISQRPGRRPNRQKWRNARFLKNVERRMKYRNPVFSPRAIGLLKRGWGKENIHNKLNKAFGRCDIPDRDVVKTMFPGLFQSVDDINKLVMQQNKTEKPASQSVFRRWQAVPSRRIRIPNTVSVSPEVIKQETSSGTPSEGKTLVGQFSRNSFICDCCKVDRFFETYENITVEDVTYAVIQLPGEGQFFAIEKCPLEPRCPFGGCIQRYTRHPILIWNDTKPYYPPLDFAHFDFPTHCEWANIGQ